MLSILVRGGISMTEENYVIEMLGRRDKSFRQL